jgi:hypothetical protein
VLEIPNFPYGRRGAFAINLWMQLEAAPPNSAASAAASRDEAALGLDPNNSRVGGNTFQYLLQHADLNGPPTASNAFSPNQASARPAALLVYFCAFLSLDTSEARCLDQATTLLRALLPASACTQSLV